MKYEVNEETVRPFRLYDAVEKTFLGHRCYVHKQNAHIGALIEARYAKIGTTIEVIDISVGRMIGQYTRRVNTVTFLR